MCALGFSTNWCFLFNRKNVLPSKTAFAHLPHCSPFGPGFCTAPALRILFYVPPLSLWPHCIGCCRVFSLPLTPCSPNMSSPTCFLASVLTLSWILGPVCLLCCWFTGVLLWDSSGTIVSYSKTLDEVLTHSPMKASRICPTFCLHPSEREGISQLAGPTLLFITEMCLYLYFLQSHLWCSVRDNSIFCVLKCFGHRTVT